MHFTINSHHVEVTSTIREYISTKLDHVLRHYDDILEVEVILSVENLIYRSEVTVQGHGKDIHVAAQEDEMYAAIDMLSDKLASQMAKYKNQSFARRPLMRH